MFSFENTGKGLILTYFQKLKGFLDLRKASTEQ